MSIAASLFSVLVLVGLVLVSALMAAADASVHLLPRGRVRRLAETGGPAARALDELADRPGRVLAAKAFVTAGSYALAAVVIGWGLALTYPGVPLVVSLLLGFAIGTLLLFTVAEALPRSLALLNPERVALSAARWALRVTRVTYPVVRTLAAPFTWVAGLATQEATPPVPWVTEDEYRAAAVGAEEETAREEAEDALIEAVADFTGKMVREVMVPRTDMVALADDATFGDALSLIEQHGFSRLPVYRETLDDIVGIVYAKDLLLRSACGTDAAASLLPAAIARPAYFVPETKPVEELLIEMRRRAHMAIVADEYGGTAGLVTIEDLLEEIVGDIFDEYDRQEPLVVDLGDGRWRMDARLPVDELDERFGTHVEMEADTVGGLFTELAGHIPEVGESVDVQGLRLTVREMQGTRIRKLDVESTGRPGEEEETRE